jgi:hypothetical protein
MYTPLNTRCPYCFGKMNLERLRCCSCHVAVEGQFSLTKLSRLTLEQQDFIEKFILADGSLKQLAETMNVSYPTVRSRLDRVIEALKVPEDNTKQRRQMILDAVEEGKISTEEAARLLKK